MGFIFTLILFAVTLVLSEVLKPKPQVENARPAGLGDFQVPTATEGRPVPLIFGTVLQKGANVIWYGDLRSQRITEKVKTGLFSSKTVTKGFRYFLGLQFGVSRGSDDWRLRRVRIADEDVWTGDQQEGSIQIDAPNLFGGEENGSGGVVGTLSVRIGTDTQIATSYMVDKIAGITGAINYRGTAVLTFEQGLIGLSANLEPWAFEVQRCPNGLGASNPIVNSFDANPACIIYEILTDDEWGLGISPAKINIAQMRTVADTLFNEGNGFSFLWDTKRDLQDIIREIERQIDGILTTNPSTGQFEILLARGGYDINTIPQVNEDDIVGNDGISGFSRGAWEDTQNFIQVQYQHRDREYADSWAPAVDEGNIKVQLGNVVNANLTYPGVKDPALANAIAWRELRTLSAPLLKVTLTLSRKFWDLRPSDVVAWTDADLGITQLPLRATRVNKGTLVDGSIIVDFVEDIFVTDTPAFAVPDGGQWDPPSDDLVDIPSGDRQIFEAPRAFCDRDTDSPGVLDRVWVGVRNQGDGAVSAEILNNGSVDIGDLADFALAGTLNAPLGKASESLGTQDIRVDAGPDTRQLLLLAYPDTVTASEIGANLPHLIRIGDELLSFESMTDLSPTFDAVQLNNVKRALCDTVQPVEDHPALTRVWFLIGNITSSVGRLAAMSVEVLTESPLDVLTPGEASPTNFSLQDRAHKPYPPSRLSFNSTVYPSSFNLDSNINGYNSIDDRGSLIDFSRRDYRLANEFDKHDGAEAVLPADFPAANSTEYRMRVINDPSGANTTLFTTDWTTGDGSGFELRRTEILEATDGVVPADLRIEIETRHTDPIVPGGPIESIQVLRHDITVNSFLDDGNFQNLGVLDTNEVSPVFVSPTTSIGHQVSIGAPLADGEVQYRVNGGSWTSTGINTVTTSGTFNANAGDDVEFRHTGATFPNTLHFLLIDSNSSVTDAYAILRL